MINNVNMFNINNLSVNMTDNQSRRNQTTNIQQNKHKDANNIAFGYQEQSQNPLQPLKDLALTLTNDFVGFIGVNAVLLWLQKTVNGKVLSGKINNHFTKNISNEDYNKLGGIAEKIKEKVGKPEINKFGPFGEAYYTELGNKVVVGPYNHSALFHELGHAFEENKTSLLKTLQRGRGHYNELAILLYMLMAQRQKPQNDFYQDEKQGIGAKISNFLQKSDAVIPLIAYTPELITEAAASIKGLKLLKEYIGEGAGKISKKAYKNIKRSYLTCFATYLFIPVSIMLVDAIRNSADKALQKRRNQNNLF